MLLGVLLVSLIQPGEGFSAEILQQRVAEYEDKAQQIPNTATREGVSGQKGLLPAIWGAFKRIVNQMIPTNPIQSAAHGDVLPVIVFSVMLGIVLSVLGPRGRPVLGFFESLFATIMMGATQYGLFYNLIYYLRATLITYEAERPVADPKIDIRQPQFGKD